MFERHHLAGLAVRGRKVVHSDTCRLCLMEIAKKLNVAGSACCSFHLVIGSLAELCVFSRNCLLFKRVISPGALVAFIPSLINALTAVFGAEDLF